MKIWWLTTANFVLFCAAAAWGQNAASPSPTQAPSQTSTQAHSSPSTNVKTKVKKTKTKAPAKSKKPAVMVRPPAEIPVVKEQASVWRGCLGSQDLPEFSSGFGVEESRLRPLLAEQGVLAQGGDCVPYVEATGGEAGAASAVLQGPEPDAGTMPALDIRKTPDGITVTPGACDCPVTLRRVVEFPMPQVAEASSVLSIDALSQVPSNIRWQLGIVLPQMVRRVAAKLGSAAPAASPIASSAVPGWGGVARDSEAPSGPGASTQMVRISLTRHDEYALEQLQSIEIVDPASKKELDGAWWLERSSGPGVLIGMEGVAYERLLWQSPVKYVQKSRGVGASVTTVNVRVPVPKGDNAKPKTRKVTVREYHIGADLIAPKGTDVHAVGDAKVYFAGRYGGYGNLIILDHGLGYQTYYAHLSVIKKEIKAGATVSRGDIIGLVGSTGHSTAPHLHFETRKDGKYIDPFDDTRQLEFWVLSPDDQERLGMEMLAVSSPSDSFAQRGSLAQSGGAENHNP